MDRQADNWRQRNGLK